MPISTTFSDCFCCANFSRLRVYATASVRRILREDNSMFGMLQRIPNQAVWTDFEPGKEFSLRNAQGEDSGLRCRPCVVERRTIPPTSRQNAQSQLSPGEASLGFIIDFVLRGSRFAYMPAVPQLDDELLAATRRLRRPALRRHFLERRRTDSRTGQRANRTADGPHPGREHSRRSWRDCAARVKYFYTSTTPIPCWTRRVLNIARCGTQAGKSRRMDGSSTCRNRHSTAQAAPLLSLEELRAQSAGHGRRALSSQASFSPVDARRQAQPRTTAGLGAESLLLPEHHSDQGFDHPLARSRPGLPPRLAQARGRSRWRRHQRRRHQALDKIGGSHRPRPAKGSRRQRHSSRNALRGERISEHRAQPQSCWRRSLRR